MKTLSRNFNSLFIGNSWVVPTSGEIQQIVNPATEKVIGTAPVGGTTEVDQAVAAAREAFDSGPWPRMAPKQRAQYMQKFKDALQGRREEIVDLIVAEVGATKMLAEAMHFDMIMNVFQFCIDSILKRSSIQPASISVHPNYYSGKTLASYVKVSEPVGVVASITPFNFPYFLNIAKLAPALCAGCTVVLKPSPLVPLQALIIGEVALEVGLPAGVLNIVTGDVDVGQALVADARVDMVSFTGSDQVGASIMAQAASTLKRVHLELGGKSALIICEDADVEAAAVAGFNQIIVQCGQGCVLQTRHIVHNSVRGKYVELIRAMAKQLKIGDPADPSVGMGPLISEAQRQKVERYIQLGLDSGATLVTGGDRPKHMSKGFFVEPTFFDNVDNSSVIAQEEIFGPVGVVIGFDSESEAVRLANDSAYGLGGGVFSTNTGKAFEIAMQMRTGGVSINGGGGILNPEVPFGGYKRSGIGREFGEEGLNEYLETKVIEFHAG